MTYILVVPLSAANKASISQVLTAKLSANLSLQYKKQIPR